VTRKNLASTPEADPHIDQDVLARLASALEALADKPVDQKPVGIDPELICLTPKQAAEVLGVTENWVTERITARRIPFTLIGRFPRFRAKHIRAIAEADEVDPTRIGRSAPAAA